MNMIDVTDLFDRDFIFKVKDDLVSKCQKYGSIDSLEIPCPTPVEGDETQSKYSYGVGKLFVKFENVIEAKVARFRISGMQYNGRTVVASFYPEQYYDIKEFNII